MQVCAVTRGGGFAEEVVVRDGAALKLPPGTDVAAAAGAEQLTIIMASRRCMTAGR